MFNDETLDAAKNPLSVSNPDSAPPRLPPKDSRLARMLNFSRRQKSFADFISAMDDDFNTAGAVAALFELVKAINTARDADRHRRTT